MYDLFDRNENVDPQQGVRVVAVPKRRKSKSRKGMRRSHDALVAPTLNICPQCKKAIPPHKVCELVEECGNVQRSKPHNPMAKAEKN
jgi:large subunit ribosomal protein L32